MMKKSNSLLYTVMIFAGLAFITTSIFGAFFTQEIQSKKLIRKSIEIQNITLLNEVIENEIKLNAYHLIFLANHKTLHQWLSSRQTEHQAVVVNFFKRFCQRTSIYDQIRFIDKNGMERVRVNYTDGLPVSIEKDDLQNKAHRYYFSETIELDFSQIFISPFDLNIEHGKVEHPIKPMIRFGMPVHDSNGHKVGIVLLNYLGSRLLEHLDTVSPLNVSKPMLINQNGYWLKALNPDDAWGFMFPDRKNKNFALQNPDIWTQITENEKGQFTSDEGFYTYSTVRITEVGMMSSAGTNHAFMPYQRQGNGNHYYWKVVSLVPASEFKTMTMETLFDFLPYYGSVLVVLFILSLWFGRTINQRIMAQNALDKSEAGLRSLFRSVPAGVGLVKDRIILEANEQLSRMTGYSKDELIGKNARRLYQNDDDFEFAGKEKNNQIKLKGTGSVEVPWKRKDGKIIDVLLSSAPIDRKDLTKGETFSAYDITDRKKTEKELAVSEERHRIIVESSNDGIFTLSEEYLLTSMNTAFECLIGQKREDWIDQSILNLFNSDDRQNASDILGQILNGKDAVLKEFKITSDHFVNDKICEFKLKPKYDDRNKIIGKVGFVKDLTEAKEAHEAVQRAEGQLRHSQKMEAIGTLAGGIAHDFNNILSGIFGYAQLAELNLDNPEKSTYHINQIVKGAQRASALVQQILTFSRQVDNIKSQMRVSVTVKEALKLLRASIPSSIKIKEQIISRAHIMGDPTQIHQIVMNLCTNAYHAMRSTGGVLTVKLQELQILDQDSLPEINKQAGNYIQLEVSDTGTGMDENLLERIFDPYFTTKEIGEGTGMGLALVQATVDDHNGFIEVDTEPNKGTSFFIYLPMIERTNTSANEPVEIDTALLTGDEKIMFVDDEQHIRLAFKEYLEDFGYRVHTFESSVAAMEKFKTDPGYFDMVITDMTMPEMTGDQLSIQLLEIKQDLPIILCTGFSEKITESKALALGIQKYIEKPINTSDLALEIREIFDREKV